MQTEWIRWAPAGVVVIYVIWNSLGVLKRKKSVNWARVRSPWTTYSLFVLLYGNSGASLIEMTVRFGPSLGFWVWIGVVLIGAKVLVTVWSVRTLGVWYSYHLSRKPGQELIRTGPYALCRHPIYASRFLATAGIPLAAGAWFCLPVFLTLDAIAVFLRIKEEEKVLKAAFGASFEEYSNEVGSLLPFRSIRTNRA
ncbi:MAG: methyltransferase family protein [Planctomycetota bacterium]|jgi:protein-S-isoprenylcysteine O-methyltransferase Ste14